MELSTNLAALAWVSREATGPARQVVSATAAYLLGKVLVYSLVGLAAIGLGLRFEQASIPVIVMARKALGPLMLLIGLFLLGVLRLNVSVGDRLGGWFERRAEGRGRLGAFLLGVAFSFTFCPTLFWLFFGLTIPLALASGGGPIYPAMFALGTTLPILAAALLLTMGLGSRGQLVKGAYRMNRFLQPAIGLVFVLVGLNDTLLYWFI